MAPLRMPTEVMPTWMVDRKLDCSLCSDSAASAPRLPSSARFWSLALREETTAISDMAKTPLMKMSMTRRNMSMLETALRSDRACGFGIEKRLIVAGAAQRSVRQTDASHPARPLHCCLPNHRKERIMKIQDSCVQLTASHEESYSRSS